VRRDINGAVPVIRIFHYIEGVEEKSFMKMRRSAWTGGSINESPKLNELVDICDQAKNEGHKIFINSYLLRRVICLKNLILKRN